MSTYDILEHFRDSQDREFSVCLQSTTDMVMSKGVQVQCEECHTKRDKFQKKTWVIVEMYDENGVDVSKRSRSYQEAKEHFQADGQGHFICINCLMEDYYGFCDEDDIDLD